jgi:hypothetical protein
MEGRVYIASIMGMATGVCITIIMGKNSWVCVAHIMGFARGVKKKALLWSWPEGSIELLCAWPDVLYRHYYGH